MSESYRESEFKNVTDAHNKIFSNHTMLHSEAKTEVLGQEVS